MFSVELKIIILFFQIKFLSYIDFLEANKQKIQDLDKYKLFLYEMEFAQELFQIHLKNNPHINR